MRSNAGMANRQGDVDLRLAQVFAPDRTLAWLDFGLASLVVGVNVEVNSPWCPKDIQLPADS